jgi:hypothetical protein
VVAHAEADRKYRIRLDEGTRLSAALPDPDIEVLGPAPPL